MGSDKPLRFRLRRKRDTETVAWGVQFADGAVVLRWCGDHPSTQSYSDWGDAMRIHHIGEPNSGDRWTTAEWLDGVCFACGFDGPWLSSGNGAQCCRCSASWDGPPSREADPSAGEWRGFTLPAKDKGAGDGC